MARKGKTKTVGKDLESVFGKLFYVWLKPTERRDISVHTIEVKEGACFGVNLKGKLGTIFGGERKVAKGYSLHLSDYPFYRIVYTASGQAMIKTRKREYTATPCSVYYFAPDESGYIINDSDTPWAHIYVHFTGTDAARMFKRIASTSEHVLHISEPNEIQFLFEKIAENCAEQSENSQVICDSYLRVLLLKLGAQAVQSSKCLNPSHMTYIRCYNYIKENFDDIISLDGIAQKCCINKIYLCRLFRQYRNISPMAYVTKLKMNKAALFLMQTDHSIKQISMMLHFNNQYYFSQIFKKIYGVSPKYFREKH